MVVQLFWSREKSVQELEVEMKEGKQMFLVAQKDSYNENPTAHDLYTVGTVATVLLLLNIQDI